ncbi:ADP-ribosylation factor-like protein [Candidatus Lokiarchaeum ossiferum]|uniref:ADP-ribosylation factor-like protein n=1 Tax=Candidatus Lokiarchaeum ossiferum TaxID=2951803 RepID=UPI00352F825D
MLLHSIKRKRSILSKKIVFVGPSGVGKSTIRKWLFEGESLFKLLENPIEPTYGFENYSYNLLQNLGVFDLAGQEQERWFSEDKNVFNDSDIILNILDSRHAPKITVDYIRKAIALQPVQSKQANIFFLIHKIDLIDEIQLLKIKDHIEAYRKEIKKNYKTDLNIYYTSIKPEHLYTTINAFVDVFRKSGLDNEGEMDTKLIQLNINLFNTLKTQKVLSLERLISNLETSKSTLQTLISSYETANFLRTKKMDKQTLVYLTEKGEVYYEQVLKSFLDLSNKDLASKKAAPVSEDQKFEPEKLIYGIMISDSNGKTLIVAETKKCSLRDALNKADNPQFDLELIPMFLNAMSKFAEEINVQDLSSFRVQGGNIKMSSLSKKNLTLTIFTHPDLDMEFVKEDFSIMFEDFMHNYEPYLASFMKTGNATKFLDFIPDAVDLIKSIVAKYLKITSDITPFDLNEAKGIYSKLNQVDENALSMESQLQIKSLKVKLLETILAEDAQGFSLIEKDVLQFI